ncbi:hypothetical protein MD484_g6316, partial [Candolleomyces efflorescens]
MPDARTAGRPDDCWAGRPAFPDQRYSDLDDLESFFYVLAYIIHVYDSQGVSHSIPDVFEEWIEYGQDKRILAKLKKCFLVMPTIPREFSDRWPGAYLELFHDYRRFVENVYRQKDLVIIGRSADGRDGLKTLRLRADDHYDYVLGLFDKAISTLE